MIEVKFILHKEDGVNTSSEVLDSRVFEKAISRFDGEISDYVYKKVLELDSIYDFIDYDNCPYIEIEYLNDRNETIYTDDCVDYMYGL